MRDGQTRRLADSAGQPTPEEFLARHRAVLVIVSGGPAGREFRLRKSRTLLGRGPSVDLALDDAAMSRQHAAIELGPRGFRLRDLGSTNGVLVNGRRVDAADLRHGDRLKIGGHEFRFLLEKCDREPRTYVVSDL